MGADACRSSGGRVNEVGGDAGLYVVLGAWPPAGACVVSCAVVLKVAHGWPRQEFGWYEQDLIILIWS